MIAHMTGRTALPKEIADQIVDRTDGVPLFIEELTKSVVESGLPTELGDRRAESGPVAALAIPTSLQASLLARLDRLAAAREVAQIGAALGRSFSHELISSVAGIPQPQLNESLKQLANAGLILQRGAPPDAEYAFKHALVQDVAYGTMLRSRRQQLHGRIAAALGNRISGDYRNTARGPSSALCGSWSDRTRSWVLAQGGRAGDGPRSNDRGGRAVWEGLPSTLKPARR
jgi:predicted ATPase